MHAAARLSGVISIALVGSLARSKTRPKDADLLVRIDRDMDLAKLARHGRRLQGQAQSHGLGADIFLTDAANQYLGRTCPWRQRGPWFRASCDALSCGQKAHLHDDSATITLDAQLLAAPPVQLWPRVVVRASVPKDVERLLLEPLRSREGREESDPAGQSSGGAV